MARDELAETQESIGSAEEDEKRDQRRTPVLEAIAAYRRSDVAQYSIPAHKSGRGVDDETRAVLNDPFLADIPLQKGADDRMSSKKVLEHAQSLAADAFGAELSLFSTNGSTLSVQLAVATAVEPGQKIALARNMHKSIISAVVLAGAEPVWVNPELDEDNVMAHGVAPERLAAALDAHGDVRAAMVVSPTYFGATADVEALAGVCHDRRIPLLVDDAWGALSHFHPELPPGALDCGADLAIGSYHKSLGSLMQGSIISVRGELIDRDRLKVLMDQFETSSASALLLASMDGARRRMALEGQQVLDEVLRLARRASDEIDAIQGCSVVGPRLVGRPGVAYVDRTKVVVDIRPLGVSGFEVADWLYEERRVSAELADHRHVMFLVTIGDDDASVDRLVSGLRDAASSMQGRAPLRETPWAEHLLADASYVMSPRDAFLGPTRHVELEVAVGEVAAEPVSPYPPGVPVVVPGQRITQVVVDFLQLHLPEGMLVKGVADKSLTRLRVVA
jgi:arginine/lysine/ornithine decarboxylase